MYLAKVSTYLDHIYCAALGDFSNTISRKHKVHEDAASLFTYISRISTMHKMRLRLAELRPRIPQSQSPQTRLTLGGFGHGDSLSTPPHGQPQPTSPTAAELLTSPFFPASGGLPRTPATHNTIPDTAHSNLTVPNNTSVVTADDFATACKTATNSSQKILNKTRTEAKGATTTSNLPTPLNNLRLQTYLKGFPNKRFTIIHAIQRGVTLHS